ncbi:acyltransferase [Streptomyces avermitilis]|uniref:Integral membrane protein n=2 Tax=Streptomyces avermitilis TaxID=33903 RepID=Q82D68_STRAW|nr:MULTISPECIES: acyltransferase [Streptomyces]KUN52036.1 acyltransferase [Streptomyces avermitilis]MYT00700.1 acyltransferase family protein [Streptomyces sp. SID5469]OOV30364.1 acyltransferase [Streptomyces avermitilis]BAC72828.1 putative integral membrane protein [Streptomyces avermitilis MA-4680 = NBRC 14893]GDY65232.1 membrane protein [Streptomyces avermitilis]
MTAHEYPATSASASVPASVPVPAPAPAPAPSPEAAPQRPGRDRYFDLLRSLALVRVVVYHLFGWAWLTILFPSMGVMFALAGSLMARSLKRPAPSVIRGRIRRLLPPLWAFSAVLLTLMFAGGWNPAKDPDLGGTWGVVELFDYLVPVGAPPYPWSLGSDSGLLESTWAEQAVGPLWYLRAYLWFVVASPLLLWALRRVPWATLLAPLALTAVLGTGLVTIPGETGNAVTDFAVYGGCWVLGLAHQEGVLRRIPRYAAVSCATLLMAFGLWWASGHQGPEGWDLNDIPLAQATWSFGFVAILLQYSPSWQELPGRLARWDRLVTLSNNRAVTIYLWHNMLIMATGPLIDRAYDLPFMQNEQAVAALDSTYTFWMFVLVWPLIGLAILAFGWIEDIAAKRGPRLWPNGKKRGRPRARQV